MIKYNCGITTFFLLLVAYTLAYTSPGWHPLPHTDDLSNWIDLKQHAIDNPLLEVTQINDDN